MPWFLVDAEVTEVRKVTYAVRAADKDQATNYVEEAKANQVVIEQHSEVVGHIETSAKYVIELD